jgi:hypothetical protein
MKIKVIRTIDTGTQTNGVLYVIDGEKILFECVTMELPWKDNERRVSCIPTGEYKAVKHRSPKFGESLWIKDVPNRAEILIHPANHARQLLGCIAPGQKLLDIDKDGHEDVTNSRATMAKILSLVPKNVDIEIVYRS